MKSASQLDSKGDDVAPYMEMNAFVNNETSLASHGFFGRMGGVSKNVYHSLNCGPGSGDDMSAVKVNRGRVAAAFGVAEEALLSVSQVHSATCVTVDKPWHVSERPEADAMVTNVPGLALGILTADCAPVLFYANNDGAPVIGAAHAGWGGALGGILEATVDAMEALGARRDEIRACVGPCIGQASYEVGEEFFMRFVEEADENERFFKSSSRGKHFMFDLAGYCTRRLADAGLRYVLIKDLDTYFNEEDFFSYRRATHRNEDDYGRQISAIAIK